MKKLVSLALVLILTLCAPGLGAASPALDAVGSWYLNALEIEGVAMSPASLGLEMILTLDADGTATISMTDEEDEAGRWRQEGEAVIVEIGDEPMAFALAEGMLTTGDAEEGMVMVFGREPEEAAAYEPAPVVANPALADFDGTWIATLVDLMGMQLPMEALGMGMMLVIEDGKVAITQVAEGAEELVEGQGALEGGMLTILPANGAEEGEAPLLLVLHEDGTLSSAMDEGGTVYFARQSAE